MCRRYRSCDSGACDVTFEYKCVAGPTIVAVKSARARDQAVKAFEDIMNAEAALGWEYVGIDEFHISEPEGFLTRRRVYVPAKILVFRRAKAQPSVAAPAVQIDAAPQVSPPSGSLAPGTRPSPDDAQPPSIKAIAEGLKTGKAG